MLKPPFFMERLVCNCLANHQKDVKWEWVVHWQFTAWDQVQFCSYVACDCNLKALVWHWQACNRMNFDTESLVAYTSRAAFVGLSWVKRLGSLWFCFLKYPPRLCQKNSQQIMCQATYKAKTSRDKIATWSLEFSRASSGFFFLLWVFSGSM